MTEENKRRRARCEQLRNLAKAAERLEEWYFYNPQGPTPPEHLVTEFEWQLAHILMTFSTLTLTEVKAVRGNVQQGLRNLQLLAPEEEAGGRVGAGEGAGDA